MVEPRFTASDKESIEREVKKVSENKREILRSIHEATLDRDMNETGRITKVIARFATLLVSLGEQADSIQNKIIWLSWVIISLTAALVVLTFVLLFK